MFSLLGQMMKEGKEDEREEVHIDVVLCRENFQTILTQIRTKASISKANQVELGGKTWKNCGKN